MEIPKVLKITKQPTTPSPSKPKAKFKTSTRKDGRVVHTYAGGRKVVLKASGKAGSPVAGAPVVDPYAEAVDAAARQKYDPVQKALGAQQDAQANRGGDLNAWYDRYKQAVAQATSANQAASTQAVTALGALGGAATTNDAAQRAQIAQQMGGDAAARGASVDPSVIAQMAQGSEVRNRNLAGNQAVQIGQGVQQTALDGQRGVAGEGIRVASLLDNAARMRELQGKGTDLQREIGDFKVSQRASLEDQASKARLEQYLATGKLQNDTAEVKIKAVSAQTNAQKARTDARNKRQLRSIKRKDAGARTAAEQRRLDIAQQNADANTLRANKPPAAKAKGKAGKPTTGVGSLTSAQEQKYTSSVSTLVGLLAKNAPDQLVKTGAFSPEVNATLVRAAMDVKAYGAVTPATVVRLHKIGVRIGGNFKQISRKDALAEQAAVRGGGAAVKGVFG